ncbi:urease accessory protein UreF [Aquibium oceanicum]|uniref:Urease accessory protein UreF n=1 Tax=Aquibium oceanicum TaxID=1670800 RepID=A0A1L3SNJ0_9HYPH|nr:urease accessory protein UreF [Aquibium oceanicum]APH70963.1 urease accessory protein UreF [Aquibium oceanicum]
MADALLRLMAWLSPAFPVGSFSYSHGLERAVQDGQVAGPDGLGAWIEALVTQGSAWNDAALFAESWRRAGAGGDVGDIVALAEALAGSRERHMEATLQGGAFVQAAQAWGAALAPVAPPPAPSQKGEEDIETDDRFPTPLPENCPYPVAVGATAGRHRVPLEDALAAYLQAFASNQLQAAIRLGVIGQSDAARLLAGFEPVLVATAARAAISTLDDLGSCTFMAEIGAMKHETQYSRLFRS